MAKSDWRSFVGGMFLLGTISALGTPAAAAAQTSVSDVTFTKDIAPLLQRSCQRCHRPDSVAPMSLITYEQARPYARAMKQRTALARTKSGRGAMPPWFLDKTIGIQKFKDDISLSDAEIALFATWADNGAPMGDPKDMPPPTKFPGPAEWTLGKPDFIAVSPLVYVPAVGSDWSGHLGTTPTGRTEDAYITSLEFMEWTDFDESKLPPGVYGSRFVFHHANISLGDEEVVDLQQGTCSECPGVGGLPIHEVGRNGDTFPDDASHLFRKRASIVWNSLHTHSTGIPNGQRNARMQVGFRFHPRGYKPKYTTEALTFGTSEVDVLPETDNQRVDSYWVAPQPIKLLNYEPHMHAGGVRMCLEAIYGIATVTLNCAGYDHNWLKTYYYEENSQPLLPKGTILHGISWIDNTAKNPNVADPRNAATFGASSPANMVIQFNRAIYLTDEQYEEELRKREEYLRLTGGGTITCPECDLRRVPPKPTTATGGGSQ